jgi:pilin/secretion family protein with methylation motif
MKAQKQTARRRGREAGFTLIEAMMAIVILVFGLIAVTNLMVVAMNSNLTGSQVTASASLCSQQMDALKATPFDMLTAGCGGTCGGIATDVANYNVTQTLQGVGTFKIRWQVTPVTGTAQLYFVQVRCQALGSLMASRTVTDLTTFRACTDASIGCPAAP